MNVVHDVSLADYSTMGLGGIAAHLVQITSRMELLEALTWAQERQLPVLMIGSGSNIVWRDEGFPGLVMVNAIERYETFHEDDDNVYVTAGSGEHWDTIVERTAQAGLSGIEALSLIPGTAGATLVQNIGAYGQEIAQTLVTAEVYDIEARDFTTMRAEDCGFSYRTSRFKERDRGRFFITGITLHLTKTTMQPPFYRSLASYLQEHGITDCSPMSIREAVIAIRSSRLPDPAIVHNNGSFFKNPIIASDEAFALRELHPAIPSWTAGDDRVKLSAAWLIEQCGYKDFHDTATGMATWPAQALVLVNESAKTTADLLSFKQQIVEAVHGKFGVTLEQEPELFPLQ